MWVSVWKQHKHDYDDDDYYYYECYYGMIIMKYECYDMIIMIRSMGSVNLGKKEESDEVDC